MVEYNMQLSAVFHSLADSTRRDILSRLIGGELSVGDLAKRYDVSLAAISKHLMVLEKSDLVRKRREGQKHMVSVVPETLEVADKHLRQYQRMWQGRHDKLEQLLKERE